MDAISAVDASTPLPEPTTRHTQTVATYRLSEVCPGCNGDWMSTIEEDAKPVLLPLMRGEERTIDAGDRKKIVVWAQMKAITLDAYYGKSLAPDVAWAFHRGRPLWGLGVAFGRVEQVDGVHVSVGRHKSAVAKGQLLEYVVATGEFHGTETVDPDCVRLALAFKELVVGVCAFLLGTGPFPLEMLIKRGDRAVPLWPPGMPRGFEPASVLWPPPVITPAAELGWWLA